MNLNLANALEELINDGLEQVIFPYVKGNSIRIKYMIIRKSRAGWLVYDSKNNNQVACLFSKFSAVALAKGMAQGKDVLKTVKYADTVIKKNYIDCVFYKNIIRKTNDEIKKSITETRYEVSRERAQQAKNSLDGIIFD